MSEELRMRGTNRLNVDVPGSMGLRGRGSARMGVALLVGLVGLGGSAASGQVMLNFQSNGSFQQDILNPNHIGTSAILSIGAMSGQVTLTEGEYLYASVNTWSWDSSGFVNCPTNYTQTENDATQFRAFVVDGVTASFQQPWTAYMYHGCGLFGCFCNYPTLTMSGMPLEFDLGRKGRVSVYVNGAYVNGSGFTAGGNLQGRFLLHDVPAFAECPPNFAPPAAVATGSAPAHVVVCDLNGDGKPDLITANYSGNDGGILLGNGDGTFGAVSHFGTGGGSPQCVATGDFDRDGKVDFVVGNYAGWVSTYSGNGGSIVSGTHIPGVQPRSIVVGDFNRDGKLDLAIASDNHSSTVGILLGNGDGTFGSPVEYGAASLTTIHPAIVAGDFDGDGKLDLAVANSSDTVSVLRGNGDGTFQNDVTYAVGGGPDGLVAGDFNGDGRLDLATANAGSNDVSVLRGNGDGTFQAAVAYPEAAAPSAIVAGDLNGDGRVDLATSNYGGTSVTVLMGNGDGTFSQLPWDYSAGGGVNLDALALGDFNGDGRLDMASTNHSGNGVYIYQQLAAPLTPQITQHPYSTVVNTGDTAYFSVGPVSATSRTYQWRRNGVALSDGAGVSGATTANLALSNVTTGYTMSAYDCVVSNACGSSTSRSAILIVNPAPVGACCHGATCAMTTGANECTGGGSYLGNGTVCAPLGHNGVMNACCPADFNSTGALEVADIFAFLNAWFAGCP